MLVLNVIPSVHLTRLPLKPESPQELDERDRSSQHPGSTVLWLTWYYKSVAEDDEDGEDEHKDEDGEEVRMDRRNSGERPRSKLKTDWKTNPRAKPGRRKDDESTNNPFYVPTSATLPVRFVKEGDQFDNWLDEGTFCAGKRIPKVELGWLDLIVVEIAE